MERFWAEDSLPKMHAHPLFAGCGYTWEPQARRMITLEILTGENAGTVFERDKPVVTIGRGPDNDLILSDYHLSSQHGQIFREDDRYIYRDLRSTNGSRIMRGSEELILDGSTNDGVARWEAPLRDGDELILGNPEEPVRLQVRLRLDDSGGFADKEE